MSHAAFLEAICDPKNFDDDTVRLVYADWLDDHGESERADFIRLSCRLDKLRKLATKQLGSKHLARANVWVNYGMECDRERDLLNAGMEPGGFASEDGKRLCLESGSVCEWERGFVESITCTWADFAQHADAIRKATPLREVNLTTWPDIATAINLFRESGLTKTVGSYAEQVKAILEAYYFGVAFNMPTNTEWARSQPEEIRSIQEILLNGLANGDRESQIASALRHFGIPSNLVGQPRIDR